MGKRWTFSEVEHGIYTVRLHSWSHFYTLVEDQLIASEDGARELVWRGQRRSDWTLSPTLDRLLRRLKADGRDAGAMRSAEYVSTHLDRFRLAARGRRGANPPNLASENDWWALGQHYGLATPLLDWTYSPFAAAYFAFEEDHPNTTRCRVVYGLDKRAVDLRNEDINQEESVERGRPAVLEFYNSLSDENPRLVAQGGLFTKAPLGTSVEDWVQSNFEDATTPVLYRILIRNTERDRCLRALNRMNINHLSLFPDLHGASRFANLALEHHHT